MENRFIINVLAICGVILGIFSCKPTCNINIPKGVKPIDWESYNDVYSVLWNYVRDCSEPHNDVGRDIKVYGWIFQGSMGNHSPIEFGKFALIDNEENIFWHNSSKGAVFYISVNPWGTLEEYKALLDSLVDKFDATDITKKCYIVGKLFLTELPTNYCCKTAPEIIIDSIDNIKFEEE